MCFFFFNSIETPRVCIPLSGLGWLAKVPQTGTPQMCTFFNATDGLTDTHAVGTTD